MGNLSRTKKNFVGFRNDYEILSGIFQHVSEILGWFLKVELDTLDDRGNETDKILIQTYKCELCAISILSNNPDDICTHLRLILNKGFFTLEASIGSLETPKKSSPKFSKGGTLFGGHLSPRGAIAESNL